MVGVELERVTKRFGRVVAVNNVSLEVPDGRFYVLLGPSGSGKTTLLYLVAGIYKPTSGRILFGGRDVTRMPPSERNVGLVFQNYALYPHMTVYDNIAFPLRLRKDASKGSVDSRVREVAKLLRIEELLDRYPSQLSGGQQQRVALARALVKEPSVLLLDEPLSNLDALLRVHIRSELKRLQRELGITAIYVTHDQSEAMALADRIVVLNTGVVQQVGSPDEIYENPRNVFVASFIGNPPANVVPGEVEADGCVRLLGSRLCRGELARKLRRLNLRRVLAAFRPEHLRVAEEPPPGSLVFEDVEVYTVEPLGKETVLTLQAGGVLIKAIAPAGGVSVAPGERTVAYVDPARVKVFDPETEVNVDYIDA